MEYTFVLPVSFYRTSEGEFACESAFAKHLIELKQQVPPQFTAIRVCGPVLSDQEFSLIASHAGRINEKQEGIYLTELNPNQARAREFWTRHALSNFKKIWNVVKAAGLVHSGPSMNLFQPNEIVALVSAKLQKRKTIAVVDIDIRNDSRRARSLNMISQKRYLAERLIFDPLRALQLGWVARNCSLVMFKGKALVEDFGRGRPSVKNFFDTAHSPEHIIPVDRLDQKLARVRSAEGPVRLVYFGRLVQRKGVDLCLRSVVQARQKLGAKVTFTIIGDGPDKPALEALAKELKAEDYVSYVPPVPFGPALFDALYDCDVLLAAPLTEDTPRSAFDAMASGMAICAYDTEYYETLAQFGPTVVTSPWMSVDGMAQAIASLVGDRERLARAQQNGRQLAVDNTQTIWLERRAAWTREFCGIA